MQDRSQPVVLVSTETFEDFYQEGVPRGREPRLRPVRQPMGRRGAGPGGLPGRPPRLGTGSRRTTNPVRGSVGSRPTCRCRSCDGGSSRRGRSCVWDANDRASPTGAAGDAEFWDAVRSLPRRQAQVVALHYLEDLSVADVAEVLEMAPGTVKKHLHDGRRTLARRLQVEEAEPMNLDERARRAADDLVRDVDRGSASVHGVTPSSDSNGPSRGALATSG